MTHSISKVMKSLVLSLAAISSIVLAQEGSSYSSRLKNYIIEKNGPRAPAMTDSLRPVSDVPIKINQTGLDLIFMKQDEINGRTLDGFSILDKEGNPVATIPNQFQEMKKLHGLLEATNLQTDSLYSTIVGDTLFFYRVTPDSIQSIRSSVYARTINYRD